MINQIDSGGSSAETIRIYEAAGLGCLLLTDWKYILQEMSELDEEVVAYRTPQECEGLIQHYLEHDDWREAIARSGQQRTLREHTYYQRMPELVDIISPLLHQRGKRRPERSVGWRGASSTSS